MRDRRAELAGCAVSVCPVCDEPCAVWPKVSDEVPLAPPAVPAHGLHGLVEGDTRAAARAVQRGIEQQIEAHLAKHAPIEWAAKLVGAQRALRRVERLIAHAQLVSPSPRMNIAVGDLLHALGHSPSPAPSPNDANPAPRLVP